MAQTTRIAELEKVQAAHEGEARRLQARAQQQVREGGGSDGGCVTCSLVQNGA